MAGGCVNLLLAAITAAAVSAQSSLDGFVSSYEVFQQTGNHRQQRDASYFQKGVYRHSVTIFNKTLVLLLEPDTSSAFDIEHVTECGNSVAKQDLSFVVKGHVLGFEESSQIHGVFIDGRFQGKVTMDHHDTYFIEDAEKFIDLLRNDTLLSIAYRSSDIRHKNKNLCGWSDSGNSSNSMFQSFLSKFSKISHGEIETSSRTRRSTSNNTTRVGGKVCGLYIQVDHLLYQEYLKDSNFNHDTAIKQILGLVHFAVKSVNFIFSSTEFVSKDGNVGPYKNIQISIIRTKIYRTAEEFSSRFGTSLQELNRSMDAVSFLNLVSGNNYDMFCASYVFTYRYFDGVLGLAWLFSKTSYSIKAGACAKYSRGSPNVSPLLRSQNTGIVSLVNYGQRVSLAVTAVTFAHELGHNFGAEHDNVEGGDPSCSPGGELGNYLMYASATSGDKQNNHLFSSCSRHSIAHAISDLLAHPGATGCLKDVAQFCGNAVVDPDEECDCGFREDCGADAACCGPADDADPAARCRLRKLPNLNQTVECSSSNGVCCDVTACKFILNTVSKECRPADECLQAAVCNGKSALCPEGRHEDDGKICGHSTKTCRNGECVGSSCDVILSEKNNFTSCQLERPPGHSKYDRSELCYFACRSGRTGECLSSAHINSKDFDAEFRQFLVDVNNGQPIRLHAGTPCDNDRGYCDALLRCRPINSEGPLARLTSMLLSEKTVVTLKAWFELYWYAVALMGVAIIALSVAFIKLCSVHTKSDNRKLPPARTFTETLRRAHLVRRRAINPANPRRGTEMHLLSNAIGEDDDQIPNIRRSQELSPALLPRNNKRRTGRGHIRSKGTRIIYPDYQVPSQQRLAFAAAAAASSRFSRPETIHE